MRLQHRMYSPRAASEGRRCQYSPNCDVKSESSRVPRTLLGAKGIATRTLLGAPGLTTRNKDATRSKEHRY